MSSPREGPSEKGVAWSSGGVAGADELMLDLSMDLYTSIDAQNAIAEIARAAKSAENYVHPSFVGHEQA